MFKLILIGLSFLFGILSIRRLRQFDVHEQEPLIKMMAVMVWGGMVSVVVSLFLYSILHSSGVSIYDGVPYSFFYVGLVEELGKLLALFICWPLIRNEMDEPTDGLIYIACVALGFSLIENFLYAQATPMSSPLIAIRLLICTPMHIAFSIFMGLAFFWAMRCKGGWGILIGAYFFSSVYHALYDIMVSYWFLIPLLYPTVKGAYRWMHQLLGYTAAHSPFRTSLATLIHGEKPSVEVGLECIDCGNGAPKPTYQRGRIRIQQCEGCGALICTEKTLIQLIHQYGSLFGNLKKKFKPLSRVQKTSCVLVEGNRVDRKKHLACFQLDEFNAALDRMSQQHIDQLERRWYFPFKVET